MGTSEALKQCCIDGATYQLVAPSVHFESSYHEYIAALPRYGAFHLISKSTPRAGSLNRF